MRSAKPSPNYASRKAQRQLLLLVITLGLVFVLMGEAAKPENWQWLWGGQQERPADDAQVAAPDESQDVDSRLRSDEHVALAPGEFRAADAATGVDGSPAGDIALAEHLLPDVAEDQLTDIRDQTGFSQRETEIFAAWLDRLSSADSDALRERSAGRVTYLQLYEQADVYRGRVVTLAGTIRRALRTTLQPEAMDDEVFYQLWLQPDDRPSMPIVVYARDVPEGFPIGSTIRAVVEFEGVLFKKWPYQASDTLRLAPLVVSGPLRWTPQGAAQIAPIAGRDIAIVVAGAGLMALVVTLTVLRRTRRAERSLPGSITLSASVALFHLVSPAIARGLDAENNTAPPASTAREMLELLGVNATHFANLVDGRDFDGDRESLYRFLYAVGRLNPGQLAGWARHDLPTVNLISAAPDHRGVVLHGKGDVLRVDRFSLDETSAAKFQTKQYYRCQVRLADGLPATVYALRVPAAWPLAEDFEEPVRFSAIYLKLGAPLDGQPVPLFAAQRIGWQPDTTLGRLGMDVGLLDEITDRTRLLGRERECFYALLAAAERADMARLWRLTPDDYSVAPLFNNPTLQRGRLVAMTGTARRVTRIVVDDPSIVDRHGIDHYYEVAVFTEDSQNNPVIFCLCELPDGFPQGEPINEHVRIPAFFLKAWTFHTADLEQRAAEGTTDGNERLRQVAPLLIGHTLAWYRSKEQDRSSSTGLLAGSLFLVALVCLWLAVWRRNARDRHSTEKLFDHAHADDEPSDLNALDFEEAEQPRFGDETAPTPGEAGPNRD